MTGGENTEEETNQVFVTLAEERIIVYQNRLETEKRQGAAIEREQLGKVLPEATDMRTVKCSLLPGCTLNGQYGVEHIHELTFMKTFVRKGKKEESNFSEKKQGGC